MSKDTIMMKDYILRASSKPFDNWKSGGGYFSNEILYPKLMKSAIYDKKLELNFSPDCSFFLPQLSVMIYIWKFSRMYMT